MNEPLGIEVVRGPVVESRHQVSAVVVDVTGRVVESFGDAGTVTPPRSAIKPVQALAVVESGAADAFGFSDIELAMACASHRGEPAHRAVVVRALARLGLGPSDLECGPALPVDERAARDWLASGRDRASVAHMCSGKHVGFLALARHRAVGTVGYLSPDHPVQREVLGVVSDVCRIPIGDLGVDGCGAPVMAMPLRHLAWGMASMVDPGAAHRAAAARLRRAMAAQPWFVAGTGGLDTVVGTALGDRGFVKTGAEGVYGAALADAGVGVALKVADGAARAAEVALMHVLVRLGAVADDGELASRLRPPVRNAAGEVVGEVRVAAAGR